MKILVQKLCNWMEDKVIKPWGIYQKLQEEPGYWIKRIEVNPGQRLSLQYHYHRKEEWFVVKGQGEVIVGSDTINVKFGDHIHIDIKEKHRITNNNIFPLVFIEIAFGECSEEDIVRINDDYGRKDK